MWFSEQWVTRQTGGQTNVAWIVASSSWVLIELVDWNLVGIYGPNNILSICAIIKLGQHVWLMTPHFSHGLGCLQFIGTFLHSYWDEIALTWRYRKTLPFRRRCQYAHKKLLLSLFVSNHKWEYEAVKCRARNQCQCWIIKSKLTRENSEIGISNIHNTHLSGPHTHEHSHFAFIEIESAKRVIRYK